MGLSVGAVTDLYGTLSASDKQYLKGQLESLLPSSIRDPKTGEAISVVESGMNALQNLGPGAIHAIQQASSGDTVGAIESGIPVVAGALALVPGVGTAAAGVVAAAGAVFSLVATALNLGQQQAQSCDWKVGDICFHGNRPFGPSDPTWLRMDYFLGRVVDSHRTIFDRGPGQIGWEVVQGSKNISATWGALAFPWYYKLCANMYLLGERKSVIAANWEWAGQQKDHLLERAFVQSIMGSDMPATLGALAKSNIGAFLLSYCRMFLASQEMAINGYKTPDPYALLVASAEAWNHGHVAIGNTFRGTSPTVQYPKIGDQIFDGNLTAVGGRTFADDVIRGDIIVDVSAPTGQHQLPIAVNGGNPGIKITGIHAGKLGITPPSTVKKIPIHIPPHMARIPTLAPASKKGFSWGGAAVGGVAGFAVGGPVGAGVGAVAGGVLGKKL